LDFTIGKLGNFQVAHCRDCVIPGYLIVSSRASVSALYSLSASAQRELGPVLAITTEIVRSVADPIKVYCAQFGEEGQLLHFHIFPRTAEITAEYLRFYPEQRNLIHGPVLLDWARTRYRALESEVFAAVHPVVAALRQEFERISS
jgi:diadenosine tetraphosphate (Ap4A) HIT family hydrolase